MATDALERGRRCRGTRRRASRPRPAAASTQRRDHLGVGGDLGGQVGAPSAALQVGEVVDVAVEHGG